MKVSSKRMDQALDIAGAARRIAAAFDPVRITLFGSHAYGVPTADSDVDLLVLMRGEDVHDRALDIREALEFEVPVDILVRSPEEYSRRLAMGDCFLREIEEKGKVLYESPGARVG